MSQFRSEKSGLGAIRSLSDRLASGVEGALKETQRGQGGQQGNECYPNSEGRGSSSAFLGSQFALGAFLGFGGLYLVGYAVSQAGRWKATTGLRYVGASFLLIVAGYVMLTLSTASVG
jgi:hypothetical protein